jgi:hypothetical protein
VNEVIPRTSAVLVGWFDASFGSVDDGCRPDCRTLSKGSLVQIRPCLRGTEGGYQLIRCGVCTQVVRASFRESLRRAPGRLRGAPGPSGGARRDASGHGAEVDPTVRDRRRSCGARPNGPTSQRVMESRLSESVDRSRRAEGPIQFAIRGVEAGGLALSEEEQRYGPA